MIFSFLMQEHKKKQLIKSVYFKEIKKVLHAYGKLFSFQTFLSNMLHYFQG